MILLVNGDKLLESDMFTEEQKKFIKEQKVWTDVKEQLPNESINSCICNMDCDDLFIMTIPFSKKYNKFNVRDNFTEEQAEFCEIKTVKKWAKLD